MQSYLAKCVDCTDVQIVIFSGDGLTAEQLLAKARDVFDMPLPDRIQVSPSSVGPPVHYFASRAALTVFLAFKWRALNGPR